MSQLAERLVTAFERLVECECMPEFPMQSGALVSSNGDTSATTRGGTILTCADGAGSENVKGAYSEVFSATPFATSWIAVEAEGSGTYGGERILLDIAVGSGGSEQVIIADLQANVPKVQGIPCRYLFPLQIPAGSRVSARFQAHDGFAQTLSVHVTLIGSGVASPCSAFAVDSYGDTAGSVGTNIDPGGTAHTKSSWVEITSATLRPINWLTLSIMQTDTTHAASVRFLIDIGIGGSGSEVVLIGDILAAADTVADFPVPSVFQWPVFIPAGTRLSVRHQSSTTTDGDRDLYVKLYGC